METIKKSNQINSSQCILLRINVLVVIRKKSNILTILIRTVERKCFQLFLNIASTLTKKLNVNTFKGKQYLVTGWRCWREESWFFSTFYLGQLGDCGVSHQGRRNNKEEHIWWGHKSSEHEEIHLSTYQTSHSHWTSQWTVQQAIHTEFWTWKGRYGLKIQI